MNKRLQGLLFYLLIIAFCNLTFSQNQKEKQPLSQILTQLENRYDVKFSFETKTIEDISIAPLYPELSLEQAINHLKLVTHLILKILSNRFIAITPLKDGELR